MTVDSSLSERVAQHLRSRLETSAHHTLTPQEQTVLDKEGLRAFLIKQVLSKKFRKWSVDADTQQNIARVVDAALKTQQPLSFVLPMGGYKIWRIPSSPEVDWAEFFGIAHILQYLSSIAAGYAPGVHMQFFMYTFLPQRHDNMSEASIERYVASFQALLDAFGRHLPPNVKLSIVRDAAFYSREEYFGLLDERYEMMAMGFNDFPAKQRDTFLNWARQNIQWNGAEDWTGLSEEQKEEKILRGAIYEVVGIYTVEKTAEFIMGGERIVLFVSQGTNSVGIGSTKASRAKFWVGTGILEDRAGAFYDLVLTPSQWERTQDVPRTVLPSDLLPLKNLGSVQVVHQPLDFSLAADATPARTG
ncbi:hypothetical protein JYK02_34275 [Corallococcus macrosporus]|uniref:DUF3396 domain-containing protein n=1 Tax=Corallococcus macrosporus TaxID=35 RepID=A0ABS3DMS5_9BACT|nr:hypothetical protein [Corallococcus macrosporus]MBN8232597.1 hypothetical protein [Corallococcus macrosporus]